MTERLTEAMFRAALDRAGIAPSRSDLDAALRIARFLDDGTVRLCDWLDTADASPPR